MIILSSVFLLGSLAGLWFGFFRESPKLGSDGKIAILISNSDEISFYLSVEASSSQKKKAIDILRGLVREHLASFGCGPFDEENLEIGTSESRPSLDSIAYAAFHCESEPFEDLTYEVDLKPFEELFSLSDIGQLSLSVARLNQLAEEQDISCVVDEELGCEFTVVRGTSFPKELSINLNDGEPFAMKARSRKPIDISCEQLSPEQLNGERFIDIQHIMSDQIHIMRDETLSMKQGRICQQLMLFSLRRDSESGLDSILDSLTVPPLRETETLADNCWDNPEKIPVPGLVGIIESGRDEAMLEARQAWDISLTTGELIPAPGRVFCRETPPPDRDDIWSSVRTLPLPSQNHLKVATKVSPAPEALLKAYSGKNLRVWEIDLDSDQKKDFIVEVRQGEETKTCVHNSAAQLLNCSWPESEDVSRYVWFVQLDEDPFLELIEISGEEALAEQRISKINPQSWELERQFDFNPLIEGRYKDRSGIFYAYPSDLSDLVLVQGQLRASFFKDLYEGQEMSGPFLVFKGVPSQGHRLELPDLSPMTFKEVLARHRKALDEKLYSEESD